MFPLALMALALIGVLAGFVSLFRRAPNPLFVPLGVTEYRSRLIAHPAQVEHDLEALRLGKYFTRVEAGGATGDRAGLIDALAALRDRPAGESVVVYLAARSSVSPSGEVQVLAADADPEDSRTWLPLREVLESFRDCPSVHKLLVLDLADAVVDPGLGLILDDVGSRLPGELRAVADPNRLVLASIGPGQRAYSSPDLGRTAFGFYFEDGLRGWAERKTAEGLLDGIVTVGELAEFVRAHVDRWARANRGARQIPTLYGTGRDFPLIALERARPRPHIEPPGDLPAYPKILHDAWANRDQWKAEGRDRDAPRAFRMIEALLLEAEQEWKAGADETKIKASHLNLILALKERLLGAREIPHPRPRSIALAESLGAKPDRATAAALKALTVRWDALPPAKPGDPLPDPAKFASDLLARQKGRPEIDLASAAFGAAADLDSPRPEAIRFLDAVLAQAQPQPMFVETLALRRLAETSLLPGWSPESARRLLELVREGEKAEANLASFSWSSALLQVAAAKRTDAEALFFSPGFAPRDRADRLVRQALDGYQRALARESAVDEGRKALDDAISILPPLSGLLDDQPDLRPSWDRAVIEARAVFSTVGGAPGPTWMPSWTTSVPGSPSSPDSSRTSAGRPLPGEWPRRSSDRRRPRPGRRPTTSWKAS